MESVERLMRAFWAGKKVLLTGHTGFKGAWLTLALHHFGAKVYGYALAAEDPSLYRSLSLQDCLAGEKIANINDRAAFDAFYRATAPDITIHMAAQALVLASYADPIETFQTNVVGTAVILDVVRSVGLPQTVVIVTSDKVYRNHESGQSYAETDMLGGFDPYSASKSCAELVTDSFRHSFLVSRPDIIVKSARAGNVIGAGDWSENRLVPDIMRALATNSGEIIIRHPESVRPWQHVLEPLSGYLRLAECAAIAPQQVPKDSFNFGPERESCRPVGEIVDRIATLSGRRLTMLGAEAAAVPEANLLHLDSSRAQGELGWHPRWNLSEALSATVAGYQALNDLPVAQAKGALTAQIDAYFQKS
ncbi:MAG: CDP-glucose 4,6-dehydratase [Negativicutes bacterium]|nr:CDP-glucose 4,6-dehydratase [Negativicutes bacterium]